MGRLPVGVRLPPRVAPPGAHGDPHLGDVRNLTRVARQPARVDCRRVESVLAELKLLDVTVAWHEQEARACRATAQRTDLLLPHNTVIVYAGTLGHVTRAATERLKSHLGPGVGHGCEGNTDAQADSHPRAGPLSHPAGTLERLPHHPAQTTPPVMKQGSARAADRRGPHIRDLETILDQNPLHETKP